MTGIDPELLPGARNAIRVCLAVQPHERVTLITDDACLAIARALEHEIRDVGAPCTTFVLEEIAPRPLEKLPEAVADGLEESAVSIFAAHAQTNELGSRMQMTDIVNRRRMRHAHMVNITGQIMRDGMRADYRAVDRLSSRVYDIVRRARTIRATTPAGSDIRADFDPELRWVKTSGLISPEKWGNLPGGEVFTAPGNVNGTFVMPQALQARAGTTGAFAPISGSPATLKSYSTPISNDAVTLAFRQHVNANDALRTGTYSKTLTFTLSTTAP